MSNCKPDDLAVVVSQMADCPKGCFLSAVVKVKTPIFTWRGLMWLTEEPATCVKSWSRSCIRNEFPDACLKPIRGDEGEHPGDVKVKGKEQVRPLLRIEFQ